MFVHFPEQYGHFWGEISKMIFENYSYGEYYNSCVLLVPNVMVGSIQRYREMYQNSKIIGYNLEPLNSNHWHQPNRIIEALKQYDEIWDYDLTNIGYLRNCGIDAKFKPMQYTESLKNVKNVENPDIDVLFFGTLTEYRTKYIANMTTSPFIPYDEMDLQTNIRYVYAFQVWGDLKNELTSRSKIILNIAPYKGANQQQARIYHDLINNKCVLSERAQYNYFGDMITEFDDFSDCAAKIRFLIKDDNWKKYTNNSFKDYCKKQYKGL